jgi:hypothetical protein
VNGRERPSLTSNVSAKMKAIVQSFLVGSGILGLVFAIPAAIHGWSSAENVASMSSKQILVLCGPLVCCVVIVIGLSWRRRTKKTEPRKAPWQFSDGY